MKLSIQNDNIRQMMIETIEQDYDCTVTKFMGAKLTSCLGKTALVVTARVYDDSDNLIEREFVLSN